MKVDYLPLGSIVKLAGSNKKIMVTGFFIKTKSDDVMYDYMGCLYPEGIISSKHFVFNHDQVEHLYFIGYEDNEFIEFKNRMTSTRSNEEKLPNSENKFIQIPFADYQNYINKGKEEPVKSNIIEVPYDLYKESFKEEIKNDSKETISISLEAYNAYMNKDNKSNEELMKTPITVPYDDYQNYSSNSSNNDGVIDLYGSTFGKAFESAPKEDDTVVIEDVPTPPASNDINVISIPLAAYNDYMSGENTASEVPTDIYSKSGDEKTASTDESKPIVIPFSAYKDYMKNNA